MPIGCGQAFCASQQQFFWPLIPVPSLFKVGSFLVCALPHPSAASHGNCSLHPIVAAVCVIPSHLISSRVVPPQLFSAHLISSHVFSPLSSSQLITTPLISSKEWPAWGAGLHGYLGNSHGPFELDKQDCTGYQRNSHWSFDLDKDTL